MDFKTEYNIVDPVKHSAASGLKCQDKTLAQQQFRDECDINVLFGRYLETGEMPQVMNGLTYGNFEGVFDFQTAMNAVRTAEGLFLQLPARIKNRFDNDPQKMLEFLADENNREEAEFLGLVTKPQEPLNDATHTKNLDGTPPPQSGTTGTPKTPEPSKATKTT